MNVSDNDRRVALFGLGASTRAVGEWLSGANGLQTSGTVVFTGDAPAEGEAAEALRACGFEVVGGSDIAGRRFSLGVISPGIPATGAFYQDALAACDELISEPELAWRASPQGWVAVTGTNGKTTTVTLVTRLLNAGGVEARAVGNIGLPPIAAVEGRKDGEVFVAELSSFQLEGIRRFRSHVSVLLNVTPDHVEWHGTLEAYAAAKERVFMNMGPGDLAIVGDDPVCRAAAARCSARGVRTLVIGEEPGPCKLDAAWVDGSTRLVVRLGGADHVLCTVGELPLKGGHNVANCLAACAAALEMGADEHDVVEGLLSFEPLAHRIEPCGEVAGVAFYDDSKATNTDAAIKALDSFEAGRCVVLLGGHDKGTDLAELAEKVVTTCSAAVAYGEAGERIATALRRALKEAPESGCAVLERPNMASAFECAVGVATAGQVVLLSPACSSFDEFGSYKQRGDAFKGMVLELAGAARDDERPPAGDGGR